jgi:hypothetical protein
MLEPVRSWRCSECHATFNGDLKTLGNCPKCEAVATSDNARGKMEIRGAAEFLIERIDGLLDGGREEIVKVSVKVTRSGVSVMYFAEGKLGPEELLTRQG